MPEYRIQRVCVQLDQPHRRLCHSALDCRLFLREDRTTSPRGSRERLASDCPLRMLFTSLTVVTDIDEYHAWQTASFGAHGAKGVHIGPHATLYTDTLLADMGLRSGHLDISIWRPMNFLREWFRPMYPEIYSQVEAHRKTRFKAAISSKQEADCLAPVGPRGDGPSLRDHFLCFLLTCVLFCLTRQLF